MKRIEVTVSPNGESRIETHGFEGQSCQTATRQFETALGAKQAVDLKPEFYQTQSNHIQQQEKE